MSASQAPCQKSPRARGYLWPLRPGALHGEGKGAVSTATTGPLPAGHVRPHPGSRRHLPARPKRAGSREHGPAPGAHVPGHRPPHHSLTQMASSSSHAGPARAIPAAAAHSRLCSPLGLPRPQLRRVQMPPPLPSRSPPLSSRCHVCQSMRTRRREAARKKCSLGIVVCSKAELENRQV